MSAADVAAAVEPALLTDGGDALRGGRCPGCTETVFPLRGHCPACGLVPEPVALPTEGTVWTFTVLHVPAPSYEGPVPYVLGVVEIGPVRVTTILTVAEPDAVRIGDRATFTRTDVGPPGRPHRTFAFRVTAR